MTMSNQFGPPLRFKAVNVKTGEESKPFGFSWSGLSYLDDEKSTMLTDFSTPAIHIPGTSMSDVQLFQSTGLHDSKGVEIFAGDVLFSFVTGSLYYVTWESSGFSVSLDSPNGFYASLSELSLELYQAIGNRWMPSEELEKRAGELLSE